MEEENNRASPNVTHLTIGDARPHTSGPVWVMHKVLSRHRTLAMCGLYLRATLTHKISTERAKCKFIPVVLHALIDRFGHTSIVLPRERQGLIL